MVSWDFTPPIGGMGRHVINLTDGLKRAGLNVSVLSGGAVPFRRVGRNIGFSLVLAGYLRRWIRKQGIDILHVHAGPGGVSLFMSAGLPVVVTANHTYAQQSRIKGERWKRLLIPFERGTYALASRIVCISADTAAALEREYTINPGKITVIPCGFPLEPWIQADRETEARSRDIVFIGRPDRRKGFDILMAAWPKVTKVIPDATLQVVGFKAVGPASVRFHGCLPDSRLRSLVGSSRLVVCPSRLEGFGLSAAEAIAAGTPVIAADTEGLRTVVSHNRTGMLVKPDADSFAAALIAGLTDDHLIEKLRRGCRENRSRFSDKTEIESHLAIYRSL